MGMDVSGRNPRSEAGEYFRANVPGEVPFPGSDVPPSPVRLREMDDPLLVRAVAPFTE